MKRKIVGQAISRDRSCWLCVRLLSLLIVSSLCGGRAVAQAENWPRWRGPDGIGVSLETGLPWNWAASEGMTGWVTPSPIFDGRRILATSGKDGPIVALLPDRRGGTDGEGLVWQRERGGPHVCSPLFYRGHLDIHDERGILSGYDGATGELRYRERLDGRFYASAVAADGRIYVSNDAGVTYVLRPGTEFEILAQNDVREEILASPAVSQKKLWLRTPTRLLCIGD